MVCKLQNIIDSRFCVIDTSSSVIDNYPKNNKKLKNIIDTSSSVIDTSPNVIDTSSSVIDTSANVIDSPRSVIDYSSSVYDHFFKIMSKIKGCRNRSDTYVL